jgi:hypothetical protein
LPKRKNLVEEMQKQGGWWKNIGDRFEEFKPSSKSKVPTEWWISAYLISRIFTKKFWWQKGMKKWVESAKLEAIHQVLMLDSTL